MTQQYKFRQYSQYIRQQCLVTRRKLRRNPETLFAVKSIIDAIKKDFGRYADGILAMCHGVRNGKELQLFEDVFGGGEWMGTEIVEELCDGERIIHADFSECRTEWLGAFDLVYSNSLDHARDPIATIKTWFDSLAPGGRMYVEWTEYSNKLGKWGNRADCFAASRDEYREMLAIVGTSIREFVVRTRSRGQQLSRVVFSVAR